jgi:hypothetical protein
MIEGMVRKIMAEAIERFAKNEGVEPKDISIVIHTKNDEHVPQYYYMVKNVPKKNEDGSLNELGFKKDILNVSFDMLNREQLAGQFISKKFSLYEQVYSEQGVTAKNMYFVIHQNQDKDFNVFVSHQKTLLKKITIGELLEL